jgi:hypothetical protein
LGLSPGTSIVAPLLGDRAKNDAGESTRQLRHDAPDHVLFGLRVARVPHEPHEAQIGVDDLRQHARLVLAEILAVEDDRPLKFGGSHERCWPNDPDSFETIYGFCAIVLTSISASSTDAPRSRARSKWSGNRA